MTGVLKSMKNGSLYAGERCPEVEGRTTGSATPDDGREAAACRVQAGGAVTSDRQKGSRGGG